MQTNTASTNRTAPAVERIRRKARITEAHARVVATLAGIPLPDEWQPLAVPAATVVATAAWRARP